MPLKLNESYLLPYVDQSEMTAMQPELANAYRKIRQRDGLGNQFLGWVDLPVSYDREEFDRILAAADKIKRTCDILIVIGIGGSYLGARAAIEWIRSPMYNSISKDTPDIYFAGKDLDSQYLTELLALCEGKDVCVNVISKSGKTTEPAIAFRIFRELLEKKYGEDGAKERIFVTTDREKGKLRELASEKGYETFVVPDDIGGRYSVLTAVGLLPIAVCGIDIETMMKGAEDARKVYYLGEENNICSRYAMIRNILYRKGKSIELFASYSPSMGMLAEWWKQLYGESEGKDGKGIFPSSVVFSTDLHSLGQIIQQGQRNLFETVLTVEQADGSVVIPDDPKNVDELNFLSGQTLDYVCRNAYLATVLSHTDGGVPNILLSVDRKDAYHFGWLVYFFELACALSGYILDVNPFDQPGVEGYKNNMYALLGKPGAEHEARREELKKRLS